MQTVLVTGGAGYIGSHACVELLNAGYGVVVADNLCNASAESLKRIEIITGKTAKLYKTDVCDGAALRRIFEENKIDAVIHFAGYKAVGESVENPLKYYRNNLDSTLTLVETMRDYGVFRLVFSSSATVYGAPDTVPVREDAAVRVTNPYGRTKLMNEEILQDLSASDGRWSIALLRYFNPIGAHESGFIGEDPEGIPNNLMPYITQVAVGKLPYLRVFGDCYDTPDGTGVRDYIHVVDLAKGHVAAIEKLRKNTGAFVYNLGTGAGYSVLDVVHAFERAIGRPVAYQVTAPRAGDVAVYFADPTKAAEELGWRAEKTLDDMCRDSWNWQSKNPRGYHHE